MITYHKITLAIKNLRTILKPLQKNGTIRYGLPFVMFIVGGSFVLKQWTSIRYEFAQVKGVSNEEVEKMGLHRSRKVTLESTYEEIQKLDIDNWENKRGPRPWEPETLEMNKKQN